MIYSNNYEFGLPSKSGDDIVDVDVLSQNFEKIDTLIKKNENVASANRTLINKNTEAIDANKTKLASLNTNYIKMDFRLIDVESKSSTLTKIVEELPTEGLSHLIYLVPKAESTDNNRYDKYLWVNIGTTDAPEYVWEKL